MQIDLEHIVCFGTKQGKSRCEDDPDSVTRNHWRPTYLVIHSAIRSFYQLPYIPPDGLTIIPNADVMQSTLCLV